MSGAAWRPGQRRTEEFEVGAEHLATRWQNDVPVLATPVVFWWTEVVAMHLLQPALAEGEMTVGAGHDRVRHLAPTGLGQVVRVSAEVTGVDGGRVTVSVDAADSGGTVYEGVHTRAVVRRDEFVAALGRRSS